MEIKRKTMSDEQILSRQNELIAEVNAVCDGYRDRFSFLGYELNVEIDEKKADEYEFSPLKENVKDLVPGYASRATVTVRRPKSEEEIQQDEELEEELEKAESELKEKVAESEDGEEYGIDEQLIEQKKADATLAEAEDKLNRSVAYTQLMLIRIYKAFWVEKLSICENTDELKNDLEEFYEKLAKSE